MTSESSVINPYVSVDVAANRVTVKRSSAWFRLPVDRVFTMKGHGTVVTGTLTSGKVNASAFVGNGFEGLFLQHASNVTVKNVLATQNHGAGIRGIRQPRIL